MPRVDFSRLGFDPSILNPVRGLFAAGSARRLAALRIGLGAVLTLRLGLRPELFLGMADQPASLFRPLGVIKLLPHMPSRGVLLALLVTGTVAGVLTTIGLSARPALPVLLVCATILEGLLSSRGKVIHNDLLALLCLWCLVLAPHSDAWSVDSWLRRRRAAGTEGPPTEESRRHGYPVRLAMLVVALAYFFTGIHKLQITGVSWVTSGNLRWVLYSASDNQGGNSLALFIADRPMLAHLLAAATVALEIGFPVVLVMPWTRWLVIPGVAGLHTSIYLTMKLNYFPWVATVVIVYLNWPVAAAWLRQRAAGRHMVPRRAAPS